MTKQEMMVLSGFGLILACGLLLFCVYGLASMVPPDDPGYWSLVLGRMFGLGYGGWVAIPSSWGLLIGMGLVFFGLRSLKTHGRNACTCVGPGGERGTIRGPGAVGRQRESEVRPASRGTGPTEVMQHERRSWRPHR